MLSRFGIKYDEKLYYLSHISNNWHYKDKFVFANEKILGLRTLCQNPKITPEMFDEYLAENNIDPDGYCLEHACQYNKPLATYLLDTLNYIPTITTFYWLNHDIGPKGAYYRMLDHYKIDDSSLSTKLKFD